MQKAISRRWQVAHLAGALLLLLVGVSPASISVPVLAASAAPSNQSTLYLPIVFRNYPGKHVGTFIPLVDARTWNGEADAFAAMTGKAHAAYLISSGFGCAWASQVGTIQNYLTHIHALGATPLITWLPMDCQVVGGVSGDINHLGLPNIIRGEWDAYIAQWATDIGKLGYPVFVRWGHEMNIPSYSWAGQYAFGANGKTDYRYVTDDCGLSACFGNSGVPDGPERYINAYRHVHDLAARLAPNIVWVWNPNNRDWPLAQDASWNQYNNYYPGDAYVDWIALDGYNWGDRSGNGNGYWISFAELFAAQLNDLARLHPTKPQMIAEFASIEDEVNPNRKPAWIRDAYQAALGFPLLKMVVWVQDNGFVDGFHNPPGPVDFRVNSSSASLLAYQQSIVGWLSEAPLK